MSVNVPVFECREEGNFMSYGLALTSASLDRSMEVFSDSLKNMIALAQKEHSAMLMAEEIEKTRRRVNALEYVFIPEMQATSRYIEAKLAERERSEKVVLIKFKDIVEQL